MKPSLSFRLLSLAAVFAFPFFLHAATGVIDPTFHYSALLEGGSQINWVTTQGEAVVVASNQLTGEIWGEKTGWINLDPTNGGVENTADGTLSGYAWGENTGWINFAPTNGGVFINTHTGEFSGYAWSEVYGWIEFDCGSLDTCVKTTWRPDNGNGGGGGGGTLPVCSDGVDNDGDGFTDYPDDTGCTDANDTTEEGSIFCELFPAQCEPPVYACSDSIDNDGDGLADYPNDPGCTSATDNSEIDVPPPPPVEECVGNACPPPPTCTGADCFPPPQGCVGDCPPPGNTTVPPTSPGGKINDTLTPFVESPLVKTATIVGLISGFVGSLLPFVFGNPITLSELLYLPLRLWSLLLSALGLKRKNRPWGVVYDAITKQPLDPAYVILKDMAGNDVASSITDLDGRYGFVMAPGTYTIVANKSDYVFPSAKLAGRTEDELYRDLYFGAPFTVSREDELIAKNIPLDPVNFNWNEFVKSKQHLTRFYSKFDTVIVHLSNILFVFGFILSAIALVVSPTTWNIIVFALYIFISILRHTVLRPYPFGAVVDEATGEPMSFAILRFLSPATGTEIAHKVADRFGRYYCLIAKGEYTVAIDRKNVDGTYTRAYTSRVPLHVKKGYIDATFSV